MAEYWIKTDAESEPQGPYRGSDLKSFAAAGQIEKEWLISADQKKWVPAKRVSGLVFPEAAPPSSTEPVPQAHDVEANEPSADAALPAAPAETIDYAGSVQQATSGYGPVGKVRAMGWLVLVSGGTLAAGLVTVILMVMTIVALTTTGGHSHDRSSRPPAIVAMGSFLTPIAFLVFAAASVFLLIYLTIWFYKSHEEMRLYTNGMYPITSGKAAGFCYIPFFNWYWAVHMPGKLADVLTINLASYPDKAKPGMIRPLQILALFPGAFIPGLQLFLISISVSKLQRSMNALWMASR